MTHDDGRTQIAIGHLNYSRDLKNDRLLDKNFLKQKPLLKEKNTVIHS